MAAVFLCELILTDFFFFTLAEWLLESQTAWKKRKKHKILKLTVTLLDMVSFNSKNIFSASLTIVILSSLLRLCFETTISFRYFIGL